MSIDKDDILDANDLTLDIDEPESADLAGEEELSDEELAITAENVDSFADDSVAARGYHHYLCGYSASAGGLSDHLYPSEGIFRANHGPGRNSFPAPALQPG